MGSYGWPRSGRHLSEVGGMRLVRVVAWARRDGARRTLAALLAALLVAAFVLLPLGLPAQGADAEEAAAGDKETESTPAPSEPSPTPDEPVDPAPAPKLQDAAATGFFAGLSLPMGIMPMAGPVPLDINLSSPATASGLPGVNLSGSTIVLGSNFNGGDASDNTYRLWNSSPALAANVPVTINSGTTTTVTFDGINSNGVVTVTSGANLTVLLQGTSTLNSNINVPAGAELTIDSATTPGGTAGTLTMPGTQSTAHAALIGGLSTQAAGTIGINGGTMTITQSKYSGAAGIGGGGNSIAGGSNAAGGAGSGGSGGTITITGGAVNVTGATDYWGGAGIGGGYKAGSGSITINGGTVTAKGGGLQNGGAAIGGGAGGAANLVIIGGTAVVTANGGGSSNNGGAGIGAGASLAAGSAGTIIIQGAAEVTSTGGGSQSPGNPNSRGNAAGIGAGGGNTARRNGGNITITGSAVVTAWGRGTGAGIGGDYDDAGATLTLDATATITAYADNASAISADGDNHGTAYYVSAQWQPNAGMATDDTLQVFVDGHRSTPFLTMEPVDCRSIGFVRPGMTSQKDYYIDAFDSTGRLRGNAFRSTDGLTDIYSVNTRLGYQAHQTGANPDYSRLPLWMDLYFRVVYKANGGVLNADPTKDHVVEWPAGNDPDGALPRKTYIWRDSVVVTVWNSATPTFRPPSAGQTFQGWNTKPDGTGDSYTAGQTYTFTSSMILFAQWSSGEIDLSQTISWAGTDVTVSPGMNAYSGNSSLDFQYYTLFYGDGGNAVTTVSGPFRNLTFNLTADGKTYKVIQTGYRGNSGNATDPHDRPKEDTAIFDRISISPEVRVTLEIDDIDMVGDIIVGDGATLTLLVKNSGLIGKTPSEANYLWGRASGGNGITITGGTDSTINIDSAANPGTTTSGNLQVTGRGVKGIGSAGKVVVKGGKKVTVQDPGGSATAINASNLTVTGGDLLATSSIAGISGSAITISGGKVSAIGNTDGISGGHVTISGGQTDASSTATGSAIAGDELDVTAGTLNATAWNYGINVTDVDISNGTVVTNVTSLDPNSAGLTGTDVTIRGGQVTASNTGEGAAISGTLVKISAGNVTANAMALGPACSGGAGIGGSMGASAGSIVISGGTVTAKGANSAAAIGGGGANIDWTNTVLGPGGAGGSVTITGGTVSATGGGKVQGTSAPVGGGAGIGGGFGGAAATVSIAVGADLTVYSSGDLPAIHAGNNNPGNGHYVNAILTQAIPVPATFDVKVAGTSTVLRTLSLPNNYLGFAYTTGTTAMRTDQIWVYDSATLLGDLVRANDDGPVFSMKALADYNGHGQPNNSGWMPVKFRDYYQVTEKYVDLAGNPVPGMADTNTQIKLAASPRTYTKAVPKVTGWAALGYYIGDTYPPQSGTYQTGGTVTINPLNDHYTVYFVYTDVTSLTVTQSVDGRLGNLTKPFVFSIYFFEDEHGNVPVTGKTYHFTKTGPSGTSAGLAEVDAFGVVTFSLAHGEAFTLEDAPATAYFRIVEDLDTNYATTFKDSTESTSEDGTDTAANNVGPRLMSIERSFDFTNLRADVPPTNVTWPARPLVGFIGLVLGLAMLAVLSQVDRRAAFKRP